MWYCIHFELAGTAKSVTGDISINTTGVITSQFANFTEGMKIQESGTPVDTTIAVGFAKTIFRIQNGFVGIGTSLPTSQLQVTSYSLERPVIHAVPKLVDMVYRFQMKLERMRVHLLLLQMVR